MLREGDWIIDLKYGLLGTVSRVFFDGVTAKFGEMTAIRKNSDIIAAPLDIIPDDLTDMIKLAIITGDKEWFMELTSRLKDMTGKAEESHGGK